MNASENDEASRAWNTVLFDKFTRFKHLLTTGLAHHGIEMMARRPPPLGARVLDVGAGFGDMTRDLAARVGPSGEAYGVDVARNFVLAAEADARAEHLSNAKFFTADVQTGDLQGRYAAAYARFGTMFFASPVAALRNIRRSLVEGGFFSCVVWRKREDNAWLHAAELCVKALVPEAHPVDEPTCGPGPFSMRDPDLVSTQFIAAGFQHIGFERHDADICIGRDLDEAVAFAMTLGPAGERIRLAGELGQQKLPEVHTALRETLNQFVSERGVYAPSSTWIISART